MGISFGFHLRENVFEEAFRIVELGRWVVQQDFPLHFRVNVSLYLAFFFLPPPLDIMMLFLLLFKTFVSNEAILSKPRHC